ncbi:LSU ribosomal protein L6P [Seinonella peptonophila]|uniref:Large ribosomal subunit protein uL6 n=1 Tax=Seinonella peptonophila TaxID=112248 RepID=A0A1M4YX75_9BACL|nr:50S ribosomal protein L6 [Seinonella peptonophila]SHF10157.1 LSU ribosomal protein L6P [Seinonella peptonophila]
MSRIGKKPIAVPSGVEVKINGSHVAVKGPKGELSRDFYSELSIVLEDGQVLVQRKSDQRMQRALHGTTRSLISNMVEGVSQGFTKELEVKGVGYRVQQKGKGITLNVGYSHPVEVTPLEGVEFQVPDQNRIIISGIDKELVGAEAARIRSIREPDPYKGKGIRYKGEVVRLKEGKAGKK